MSDEPTIGADGADPARQPDAAIGRGDHRRMGRTILKGSGQLLGGRLVRTLVTLVGMMVLARLLAPADFGVLALATTATVLSLVILEGVIDYPAIRNDDLTREGLRSLIWGGVLVMLLFSAGLWLIAPFAERELDFPHLANALRAMIPVSISQVFFVAGLGILRRHHRFGAASVQSVVTVLLYVTLSVLLVVLGYGLYGVLAGMIAANILSAIVLASLAKLPVLPPRSFSAMRAHVHLGGYGALSRLINWAWASVDTLAASILLGPTAAGLYSRAHNINVQAKEPFLAVDQTMRQAFASAKSNGPAVGAQMIAALRLVTLASAIIAAAIIILRDEVVLILLGTQWADAALPLAVLAAGLPPRIARLYFDGLAVVVGDVRGMAIRHIVLLGLVLAGLALFAARGLPWVAAAMTVPLYLSLLFAIGAQERAVIGPVSRVLAAMVPGMTIAVLLVTVCEWLVRPLVGDQQLLRTAIDSAILGMVTLVTALAVPDRWLGQAAAQIRRRWLPFASKLHPA